MSNNIFNLPSLVKGEELLNDKFAVLKRDLLMTEQEHCYTYYSLVLRPFAVVVLAVTENDEILAVQEYRHPTGQVILGCPGGLVEDAEPPLLAARRELLEETGYDAETFEIIGQAYSFPGVTGQSVIFVRARNAKKIQEAIPEPSELIAPLLLSGEEISTRLQSGEPLDSLLCSALFFHRLKP